MVGLTVDGARHVLSPECRTTPQNMWRQCQDGIADTPRFKKAMRICKVAITSLGLLWLASSAISSSMLRPIETDDVPAYFAVTSPMETVYSSVSSFDRRAFAELTSHGYPNRAKAISILCSLNFLFFVLTFLMTFAGYTFVRVLQQITTLSRTRPEDLRTSKMLPKALGILLLGVLFHASVSNLYTLKWNGYDFGFSVNLTNSNKFLYEFDLGECAATLTLCFSYQFLVCAQCIERGKLCLGAAGPPITNAS